MRSDADERVLRISGDGHHRADVRRSGQSDEIRKFREMQTVGDGENDGSEDEANGVVDEKGGEDSRSEDEQHEKLKARAGERSDMDGDPVEKMRDLEMRDENHDAEEENNRVPTDRAIRAVERDDSDEHHGDGAAKSRSGAVEMAAAAAFDGDEDVGDEENNDGEPVKLRQKRDDGCGQREHAEGSLARFAHNDYFARMKCANRKGNGDCFFVVAEACLRRQATTHKAHARFSLLKSGFFPTAK